MLRRTKDTVMLAQQVVFLVAHQPAEGFAGRQNVTVRRELNESAMLRRMALMSWADWPKGMTAGMSAGPFRKRNTVCSDDVSALIRERAEQFGANITIT